MKETCSVGTQQGDCRPAMYCATATIVIAGDREGGSMYACTADVQGLRVYIKMLPSNFV